MRILFHLLFWLTLAGAGAAQASERPLSDAEQLFQRGLEAYRAADFAEAEAHWSACYAQDLAHEDKGRLAYNLGNAAYRQQQELRAVGWYTLALRHLPRDRELWQNLELARAEAGLEPADGGDLAATLKRLLGAFHPAETRQLMLLGLVLLGLACLGEALRGGRLWTRAIWISLVLFGLCSLPWLHMLNAQVGDPVMILGKPSVALRSEPRLSLPSTGKLLGGAEVERIDELPDWVRVEDSSGKRGWVQASAVFALRR